MSLVPRLLAVYHTYAVRFTNWENHAHQSTHDASLTIKTFSLSAIVAYGGLALSAFVYVPFGEEVMTYVQTNLFHRQYVGPLKHSDGWNWASTMLSTIAAASPTASAAAQAVKNATGFGGGGSEGGRKNSTEALWELDGGNAKEKLNPSRLQNQMFAVTVTNQVVNTFLEIGLPYVMRAVESVRSGKGLSFAARSVGASHNNSGGAEGNGTIKEKKRVAFEDDDGGAADLAKSANGKEEKELMERIRREVALPEYTLFADYSEMVTQFGYVALWSTIWPLAPGEYWSCCCAFWLYMGR